MKESEFIRQNNKKWAEIENLLQYEETDPAKTSRLLIKITDDLSYARTFYNNRTVRGYLNGVAQEIFDSITFNERYSFKRVFSFFKLEVPIAIYVARRPILLSLLIFAICFLIGVATSITDSNFATQILSEEYIWKTDENIEAGTPMAIYDSSPEFEMFVNIAMNNLMVAFRTFVMGFLVSIGSLIIIMYNGVMVGVFQYYFISKGLFIDSFLAIWTHGTLEIASIIVAGGAGLMVGKGLLFPETFSRSQAFKASAKVGIVIMAGISPIIVLAAFIESFQTRHTEINDIARLLFILACAAFVFFYFFWYPRRVAKEHPDYIRNFYPKSEKSARLSLQKEEILSAPELFAHFVNLYFKNIGYISLWLITAIVVFIGISFGLALAFYTSEYTAIFNQINILKFDEHPIFGAVFWVISSILLTIALLFFKRKIEASVEIMKLKFVVSTFLSCSLISVMVILINTVTGISFLSIPVLLFMSLFAVIGLMEGSNILHGVKVALQYLQGNWGKWIQFNLLIYAIIFSAYLIRGMVSSLFGAEVYGVISNDGTFIYILTGLLSNGVLVFLYLIGMLLFVTAPLVIYYTLKESNTADGLFDRIRNIKVVN